MRLLLILGCAVYSSVVFTAAVFSLVGPYPAWVGGVVGMFGGLIGSEVGHRIFPRKDEF